MGTTFHQAREVMHALSRHAGDRPLPGRSRLNVEVPGDVAEAEGTDAFGRGRGVKHVVHTLPGYSEYSTSASAFDTLSHAGDPTLRYGASMEDTIGGRIAALRIEAREAQADLAAAIGRAPSMVSHYEQGRRQPSKSILFAIARHYGVSADWLETGKALPDGTEEVVEAWRRASPETRRAVMAVFDAYENRGKRKP